MSAARLAWFTPLLATGLMATHQPACAQWGAVFNALNNAATSMERATPKPVATEDAPARKTWRDKESVSSATATEAAEFAARSTDPALRPFLIRLYIEGERGAVLNLQRLGLAAMAVGQRRVAEAALDMATSRIERFYVNDTAAQKAKSLWSAESVKDFKGDPFERAMAFYYRGLLYAGAGDYENARASFKRADIEDAFAGDERYAGDFALMPWLAAWASACEGNASTAQELMAQAVRYDASLQHLPARKGALVLFEEGRAPFKYAAGLYGEKLKFSADGSASRSSVVKLCRAAAECADANFQKVGDVAFQATTRGGRVFDAILDGKASFADGAATVASTSGLIGRAGAQVAAQTGSLDAAKIGLLGSVMSLGAKAVEKSTQAQADIREWGQLPASVWLQYLPAGVHTSVSVVGKNGATLRLAPLGGRNACSLHWGMGTNPLRLRPDIEGPTVESKEPRDAAMRTEMRAALLPALTGDTARAYAPLFAVDAVAFAEPEPSTQATVAQPVRSRADVAVTPPQAPITNPPPTPNRPKAPDMPPIF